MSVEGEAGKLARGVALLTSALVIGFSHFALKWALCSRGLLVLALPFEGTLLLGHCF
jgi:hypothetical protein